MFHLGGFGISDKTSNDPSSIGDTADPVNGYVSGLVGQGMRKALCGLKDRKGEHISKSKHGHKDRDHHKHHGGSHKNHGGHHGHHDHPGKGKPPMGIPPKMAESIFLSVPNHESVRE